MTETPASYYGKPIIKAPVWKPEIPRYFFTGGVGGVSATLSAAARVSGNDVLARRALFLSSAALSVSPFFLIKDLGRPRRFYNMLRVFKPTSPMSVGSWLLGGGGTATGLAAACELSGLFPALRAAAQATSGALGPPIATYTGALVADSVVPVWHEARYELPTVFAGGSAAGAGGILSAITPTRHSRPARRLALVGAVTEVVMHLVMEKHMGELIAEPYRKGRAGEYARAARGLLIGGAALMAAAGKTRVGAIAAGGLLAAGSWCSKFAVFEAGKQSAADPTYTSSPQKARAARRGQPAVTR